MAEPDNYTGLSLLLARVMDDIGINEECIKRQRKTTLLLENELTLQEELKYNCDKIYIFGSRSEVTSTRGLKSDTDKLHDRDFVNAIQDCKDWLPGKINLLMIETEFPGYCKLQLLNSDKPLPTNELLVYCVTDERGRLLLENKLEWISVGSRIRNGPAFTFRNETNGFEYDNVYIAFKCEKWPKQYRRMSLCQRHRNWPTPQMVRYIETSGCFVVPKGHRLSDKPEVEWRISTSLAERCLMFSLNVTQIQCYILLKMFVKRCILPYVPDVISSYICKTLLFHCIERTDVECWKEWNLLKCVTRVLLAMLTAVNSMDCPNYFNKLANLLLGKLDGAKQKTLLQIIREMVESEGAFLVLFYFDNINGRLIKYIIDRCSVLSWDGNDEERNKRCVECLKFVVSFKDALDDVYTTPEERNRLLRIIKNYARKGSLQSEMISVMYPFLCSYLASLEANESIIRGTDLAPINLLLFKRSLNSDATSSRLKYASYLYCTGQLQKTMTIIEDVEKRISGRVLPVCPCYLQRNFILNPLFVKLGIRRSLCTNNVALFVSFRQAEIHCCPLELQFEMFRSTEEDITHRDVKTDEWMDRAVIDPTPYIYFLQYMAYRRLGQGTHKEMALNALKCATNNTLLTHRKTAFNLLGQCMEHEKLYEAALLYYKESLTVRRKNNAAKWHIGRLLYSLMYATSDSCNLQ